MNTYGKTASYGQLLLYNLLKIKIFFFGVPSETQSISRFRIPLSTEQLTPVSGNHGLTHGMENNGWMVEENTDQSF